MRNRTKPSVLIIMSDEQRADALGCCGNDAIRTPAIDAFAREGIVFERCYTPYPLCCPSRASLWTGLLPHRHHCIGNWRQIAPALRNGGPITAFADAGYHTIYCGKWHVPGTDPHRLGFDHTAAIPVVENGQDRGRWIAEYRDYIRELGYPIRMNARENLTFADEKKTIGMSGVHCGRSDIPLEHYLEPWQTDRFLEMLDETPAAEPFFAVCSFNAPHFPMIVPAPYDQLHDLDSVHLPANCMKGIEGKPRDVLESSYHRHTAAFTESDWRRLTAHYWGFCSLVDDMTARIIERLKSINRWEDTIVVYTSDHGDMIGSHSLNHKGYEMHYEEVTRVPLVMRVPNAVKGARRSGMVSLMDLVPTIAELCGVDIVHDGPDGAPLDGCSFVSLLAPSGAMDAQFRDRILVQTFENCHGGKGDYVDPGLFTQDSLFRSITSLRTERQKYVFHWDAEDEFYDLAADPNENRNLLYEAPTPVVTAAAWNAADAILNQIEPTGPVLAKLMRERMNEKRKEGATRAE